MPDIYYSTYNEESFEEDYFSQKTGKFYGVDVSFHKNDSEEARYADYIY